MGYKKRRNFFFFGILRESEITRYTGAGRRKSLVEFGWKMNYKSWEVNENGKGRKKEENIFRFFSFLFNFRT